MKFSIQRDPKGHYLSKCGTRVNVSPSLTGKDYATQDAFIADHGLTDYAATIAKAAHAAEAVATFEAALKAGYHDATLNVTIGITDADQTNWAMALTALANAERVMDTDISGQPVAAIIGPIKALDGSVISAPVTVGQFRALLLAATQAIGSLRGQLTAALAAAESQ